MDYLFWGKLWFVSWPFDEGTGYDMFWRRKLIFRLRWVPTVKGTYLILQIPMFHLHLTLWKKKRRVY